MGIETTMAVSRTNALKMLRTKGIEVYDDDSLSRLASLLYENRDTIFENYCVFEDDDPFLDETEFLKESWWQ